jgi:hypothetical protein
LLLKEQLKIKSDKKKCKQLKKSSNFQKIWILFEGRHHQNEIISRFTQSLRRKTNQSDVLYSDIEDLLDKIHTLDTL